MWFLSTVTTRVQRTLPRPHHDRPRGPRGPAPGVDRHDLPPGAPRAPRPPVGAARPGVRARPPLHVDVLHHRLDPAPRRHGRRCSPRSTRRSCCSPCSPLPTVLTSTLRPAVERSGRGARARPASASPPTSSPLATTAPPGKEVRVTGIGPSLVARRRDAWEGWYGRGGPGAPGLGASGTRWRGRCSAGPTSARVVFVASGLHRPPGDVLLVLAAGARLSAYIGATVGEIGFLRGHLDGRLPAPGLARGLRRVPRRATPTSPVPATLADGASTSSTCRSPTRAPTWLVLDDVSLHLPPAR